MVDTKPQIVAAATAGTTTAAVAAAAKHFMTPIGPLQLTGEEVNEILMKRAVQAANAGHGGNSGGAGGGSGGDGGHSAGELVIGELQGIHIQGKIFECFIF